MEKFNTLATSLVTILKAFGGNIESIKSDVSETRSDVEAIKKDISDIKAMLERLMVSAPQPIEEPSEDAIEALASELIEVAPIEESVEESIDATTPQPIDATTPQPIDATTPQPIEEPAPVSEEPYDWRKYIGEEAPEPIEKPVPLPKRKGIRAPEPEPIPAAAPVSSDGEIRARFDALSTVQRRGIARAFLLTITPALDPAILRNPSNLSWEFCESVDTNNIWGDYVENALK